MRGTLRNQTEKGKETKRKTMDELIECFVNDSDSDDGEFTES